MITLLYQSPWPIGGSTSYTVHLARVLGAACRVVRIGNRTEPFKRKLHGVPYQNVSFATLCDIKGPILLTASNPKQDEEQWATLGKMKNVWATFHDPNEFGIYPHWLHFSHKRVINIRHTGADHIPHGRFIPHPYARYTGNDKARIKVHAVSLARTSSVKHSDWILDANRLLPVTKRVELYGSVNRLWMFSHLKKKYPEFKPRSDYPREFGAGVRLCAPARYMVDLTIFKGDGGGTQYTLLEAMDAGAIPVMTRDWCSYAGPAATLGPCVGNAAELVTLLRAKPNMHREALQRKSNYHYLDTIHNPETIRQQYLEALCSP